MLDRLADLLSSWLTFPCSPTATVAKTTAWLQTESESDCKELSCQASNQNLDHSTRIFNIDNDTCLHLPISEENKAQTCGL